MKIGSGKITTRWRTCRHTIKGGKNDLFIGKQTGFNAQIRDEGSGKKHDSGVYWVLKKLLAEQSGYKSLAGKPAIAIVRLG
jgi:hypothetical protein